MNKGTVKWFNNQKGYGFITDSEGKDIFVHYSAIQMDGFKTLIEGDVVEYEIGEGTTGREQAVNVKPIITRKIVAQELSKGKLHLNPITDSYGVKKYLVVNADDVLQTDENGMTLVETAAYAGIDVEGLK